MKNEPKMHTSIEYISLKKYVYDRVSRGSLGSASAFHTEGRGSIPGRGKVDAGRYSS